MRFWVSETKTIRSWSFSRLDTYETCPYRAKLQFVDKLPEPERKPDHPAARGDRIHKGGELFVRGEGELQPEFKDFAPQMQKLRQLYIEGKVEVEQDWNYDDAWQPTTEKYPWLRIKTDVWVSPDPSFGIVIDHKSGRKFGNEIKHTQQTQLYALGAFLRNPDLDRVTTEIWYVDQNDTLSLDYHRDNALKLVGSWERRAGRMLEDTMFKPRPGPGCKYCPYSPRGTGACPVGV
jgi:CRISPR/Cas system-associated exonuclease Cas4 (RecB family)